MLRITAVSPGAVDYLLNGSDCAEHEHAHEAPHAATGLVTDAHMAAAPRRVARVADAVSYMFDAAAAKEPAGVWFGEGLSMLGIPAGGAATEAQVRAVFGRLEHPARLDQEGKAVPLGSRARTFASREARLARSLAADPDTSEERRAEIRAQVQAQTRKAVAYYDFTFSPAKSVSVYWTALLEAGRDAEAANVVAAHRAGVAAAMAYVEQQAAYVRTGYHGKTVSGQSVGVYEAARGLVWIRWDHSTSRAQQPQLHSHVSVLNRAETDADGVIRALASRGFKSIKQAAEAIYTQASEHTLTATNPVVFAWREDGKAREIVGFSAEVLAKASSRSADVKARRAILLEKFEQQHGRAPSPAERKKMDRTAWRDTRQAKNRTVAPRQQLGRWASTLTDGELDNGLTASASAAGRVAVRGHPEQDGYLDRSREQVLRAAVRAVQDRYATWDVGNLAAAIADEQTRTPAISDAPQDLAAGVLRTPGRYGIVMTSVRDIGTVPPQLRRSDGLSRFRLSNAATYTTTTQLATEAVIVARARGTGATAVAGPALELARVELQAAGLSLDQQTAVLQVLSSGRRGDVLIGPAGAGKSRTVGALAEIWQTAVGGRVLGLATSQIATRVLVDDGLTAINTSQFLARFGPDAYGRMRERLHAADLLVLDEAGMSGTAELDEISALVSKAGAKLLYTGDNHQLAAVGAGGMLELLVRDAGAIELTQIHRFTHPWEAAASIRLRAGDPNVLAEYDAHGRIRGGTEPEMTAAAVRGYLADALAGHRSLLVVRDNATAAELSGQIRAELVMAGRVSAEVLGRSRDGNPIGVGDLIQARRNDWTLRVRGSRMVTNREVYQVLGRNRFTGSLDVRDRDGVRADLPARYVAEHTRLAYAVTAYGSQGLDVDSSHSLVDRGTNRAGVYVPGTRGRDANTFYVICQHQPDHHDPERIDSTPVAVLTDILTRPDDGTTAAELARRAGAEETRSLAWVGTQWALLTADQIRHRTTDILAGLVAPDVLRRAVDEPGYDRLTAAMLAMELAGHNPSAVLSEAVARGSLHTARSICDVLRYRIRLLDNGGRTPERAVRHGDWTTFIGRWAGPVGDYVQVLAAAATARQTELGARAAADPPGWAVAAPALGVPPVDPARRTEWVRRAGIVAAYRDLHGVPDGQLSIGEAPNPQRALHHALWHQALTALGHLSDALDYATATDAELREMRDAWRRARTWAPPYVADTLHDAREVSEEYRRDAVIWRAGLHRHPPGSAERALAERDLAAAEHLAAVSAARVAALERVQAVRADWVERTRTVEERARFARDELERRGLHRDTTAPAGEQQELFTVSAAEAGDLTPTDIGTMADTAAAHTAAETAVTLRDVRGGVGAAQLHLDVHGVPGAVSPQVPDAVTASLSGPLAAGSSVSDSEPTTGPSDVHSDVATEPPATVPDGYDAAFAEAARAADRDRHQPALFDLHPNVADLAAAQPLDPDDTVGGRTATEARQQEVESTCRASMVTVAHAARQADILAALRVEINARHGESPPGRPGRTVAADVDTADDIDETRGEDERHTDHLGQGQGLST